MNYPKTIKYIESAKSQIYNQSKHQHVNSTKHCKDE